MSEPFLGQITTFGFNFAPRGWAMCDGALLAINSNQALYSLLGTYYGGDGRTNFGLPDLRGRTAIHFGGGHGIGTKGGVETVTMTAAQLPSHTHTVGSLTFQVKANSGAGNNQEPAGNYPSARQFGASAFGYSNSKDATMAADMVTDAGATVGNTGGGQAHENRQPYLAITWCIALVGLFPSRN